MESALNIFIFQEERMRIVCMRSMRSIWIWNGTFVDARGNKDGVDAQFETEGEPKLAFLPDEKRGEYFVNGIFVAPHEETMQCIRRK